MSERRGRVDRDLRGAVSRLELPIVLVDLYDFTVHAVSGAALKYLGLPAASIIGHPVREMLRDADQADARTAMVAMRDGAVDFYRAHRRRAVEGPEAMVTLWVRALDFGEDRLALVEVAFGGGPRRSALVEYFGAEPAIMAVGITDASWKITALSRDIVAILHVPPDAAIGRRLLSVAQRRDMAALLDADRQAGDEFSVAVGIRLKDGAGTWTPLCCVLSSLAGSGGRCFMLVPEPDLRDDASARRAARLEQHLMRIAGEVEASGVLQRIGDVPDPFRFPQMAALSTRQWEVLSRLMKGERVPTIATELFVTQSTVRNHLAAIFERFEVHSQAELLALLAHPDGLPA